MPPGFPQIGTMENKQRT